MMAAKNSIFIVLAAVAGWFVAALFEKSPDESEERQREPLSALVKSSQGRVADGIAAIDAAETMPDELAVLAGWALIDDVGEIERRLELLSTMESDSARYIAGRLLFQRWAALDAGGALQFAFGISDDDERERSLGIILGEAVVLDRDSALESVLALRSREQRREATGLVLVLLSVSEPARCFELAIEHGLHVDKGMVFNRIARNWVAIDPVAAAKAVDSISNYATRQRAKEGLVAGMKKSFGLEGALDRVASESDLSGIGGELLEDLAETDPIALATRLEFADAGFNIRMAYAKSLAKSDPAAAVAWLEESGEADPRYFESIAELVAGQQPDLALELLRRESSSRRAVLGEKIAVQIASNWAADPELGIERVAALEDSGERRLVGEAMAEKLAEDSSGTFFAMWQELRELLPAPADDAEKRAEENMWIKLFGEALGNLEHSDDPTLAARVIAAQPDEFRDAGLGRAMRTWAYVDAPAAAAFFDEQYAGFADDRIRGISPITEIATSWASNDPMAAAEWLTGQAPSLGSAVGISRVMETWVERDPEAASDWLGQQPDSRLRESGARAIVKYVRWSDPQTAIIWAGEMSDTKRGREQASILDKWVRSDPQAAATALEQGITGLDPELRAEWQQRAAQQIEWFQASE